MTVVLDSGAVVAALADDRSEGRWAEGQLGAGDLVAPHIMPSEAANVLRRLEITGALPRRRATTAHERLVALPVDLVPYGGLALRVWELRGNLTIYDAWYVALAESLDAPLVTLDRRLARAPGPRCEFRTPDEP